MRRLANTLAGRRPFRVEAALGTTEHKSRSCAMSKRKLPACSIDQHRSCGLLGVSFIALDRLWASVAIL
jgi:hypothetical protein